MLLLSPSPNLQISSVEKKPLFAPRLLMQILSACWWSLSENIGLTRRPHPSLSRATSINHSQSLSLTDAHPVDTIASLFLSRLRPPGRDEPRTPRDVRWTGLASTADVLVASSATASDRRQRLILAVWRDRRRSYRLLAVLYIRVIDRLVLSLRTARQSPRFSVVVAADAGDVAALSLFDAASNSSSCTVCCT